MYLCAKIIKLFVRVVISIKQFLPGKGSRPLLFFARPAEVIVSEWIISLFRLDCNELPMAIRITFGSKSCYFPLKSIRIRSRGRKRGADFSGRKGQKSIFLWLIGDCGFFLSNWEAACALGRNTRFSGASGYKMSECQNGPPRRVRARSRSLALPGCCISWR